MDFKIKKNFAFYLENRKKKLNLYTFFDLFKINMVKKYLQTVY